MLLVAACIGVLVVHRFCTPCLGYGIRSSKNALVASAMQVHETGGGAGAAVCLDPRSTQSCVLSLHIVMSAFDLLVTTA